MRRLATFLLLLLCLASLAIATQSHRVYLPVVQRASRPAPPPTLPPTATARPGLTVRGHVRLESPTGPGLGNVAIRLFFASYGPGDVVATTNADGYYETPFFYIPGDEMVTVWAELAGYSFDPQHHYWRHYGGVEDAVRDFVAHAIAPTPTETQQPTPTITPTRSPTPECSASFFYDFSDACPFFAMNEYPVWQQECLDGELRMVVYEGNALKPVYPLGSHSFTCRDCIAEVDGRHAGATYGYYGLIYLDRPSGDYYAFLVDARGDYAIARKVGGELEYLQEWTFSPHLALGLDGNHLRFERSGCQLSGYANGHYLGTAADCTLAGHLLVDVAVGTWDVRDVDVRFDNFGGCSVLAPTRTATATLTPTPSPSPTAIRTPTSTSTPTPTPTATATRTTVPGPADVQVAGWCSQFDAPGNDNENLNEEYVCFQNQGESAADMSGWHVRDAADHTYTFPSFTLPSGAHVRLHTGSGADTASDLYWGQSRAVWNNGGDTVLLYDSAWQLVDEYSYS